MSKGRAYLGLVRGGWLDFLGLHPKRPITALREAFACIRLLLQQSREPYHGQVFSLAGGEALRWRIHRPDLPFLLGTWGLQTLNAGLDQIAEVKIGGTANPRVVPTIQKVIGDVATQNRDAPAKIGIAVGAVTIVDRDGKAARETARREAALYLNIIARLDPTLGIEAGGIWHTARSQLG